MRGTRARRQPVGQASNRPEGEAAAAAAAERGGRADGQADELRNELRSELRNELRNERPCRARTRASGATRW